MKKITPFLWFDKQAEEAANFYVSVFSNSKIHSTSRYAEGSPFPAGTLMSATFELDGQEFIALNAGPHVKFNDAISFLVQCETQEEIDQKWKLLTADGGQENPCGWLKDKFGLSWQIVPPVLGQLLSDNDREKAGRVMKAMMGMKKIIIADLLAAANG